MGFFSGLRKRVKKFIPKEVRPFVPYLAAMIPGGQGLGFLNNAGLTSLAAQKGLLAGGAKFLSDDEADLKDIGITSALAATPELLKSYGNQGMVGSDFAKSAAGKMVDSKGLPTLTTLAAQGGIDAGIKAAELNEDALDKYNRELAAQGINDKAGRRAAIRSIYANTGTWDMDEVDGMLDTYGYRTGGRVGYAMGDRVDTEQIIEDFQSLPSITKGIGNLARAGVDNIDKIIEMIIRTNPMLAAPDKLIEILVERYGVDPGVAQRKIINRMSDANEGFGPQGPQGTPDDGYNPNIGIDAGAEDYYGETPAMPENLGDMGGNMDDMSGNSILNRLRRGQQYEEEVMPRPDMKQMPLPLDYEPKYDRMPLPLDYEPKYTPMMSGGRVGYEKAGFVTDPYVSAEDDKDTFSLTDLVTNNIKYREDDEDEDEGKKSKKKSRTKDDDLGENIEMAIDGYNRLYPEIKPASIRPLTFQDGGSVDDRLMERVKELQDEGLDFASALAQAMKEDMASGKAMGGIMDGIDVNMREQIDTPRGDMMIDENMEVADSSLMDAYEIYKFDMMEQGLEPMSLEEFREQAIAESKMASMKSRRTMAAEGGLMNLGGKEMDLRGGGFVPMGAKERADDVPARLSKNEFVMTADAVRAAGGGSVQKGADLMYDQMKQLEGQA
jgi:hypothetical protein